MNKLGVRILLIGWPERTINYKYLDRVKQEREIAGSLNAFSRAEHTIPGGQWEAHTWQQETFPLSQVYPSLYWWRLILHTFVAIATSKLLVIQTTTYYFMQ